MEDLREPHERARIVLFSVVVCCIDRRIARGGEGFTPFVRRADIFGVQAMDHGLADIGPDFVAVQFQFGQIGADSGGWKSGCGRSAAKSRSSSEKRRPNLIEKSSENA